MRPLFLVPFVFACLTSAEADNRPVRFDILDLPSVTQSHRAFADLLCERAGLRHVERLLPTRREYSAEANAGRDFFFMPKSMNTGAIAGVRLATLFEFPVVAAARRGLTLSDKGDLAALGAIAFPAGTPPETGYMMDPSWRLRAVPSVDNGLRMLAAGRVDAVIDVEFAIDGRAAALGLTEQVGKRPDGRVELYRDGLEFYATPEAAGTPEAASLRTAAETLAAEGKFGDLWRAQMRRPETSYGKGVAQPE